jgi:hypothetical protein
LSAAQSSARNCLNEGAFTFKSRPFRGEGIVLEILQFLFGEEVMIAGGTNPQIGKEISILSIVLREVIGFKEVFYLFVGLSTLSLQKCYFLNKIKSERITGRYIVNWHF